MRRTPNSPADWERRIEAARDLHRQADWLNDRGHSMAAYHKAIKAVDAWRLLTRKQPNNLAAQQGMAEALSLVSGIAPKLGRRERALESAKEAAAMYGHLAQEDRNAFGPHEAISLANLAYHLGVLGRREEALETARKALFISRMVQGEASVLYESEMLSSLGFRLSDSGDQKNAEKAADLSISMLYRESPQRFINAEPRSIKTLRKVETRRREAALKEAWNRLRISEMLSRLNAFDDYNGLAVVYDLHRIGIYLGDLGRREEALSIAQRAVAAVRKLEGKLFSETRYSQHLVARFLNILGIRLSDLGRVEEARDAVQEAFGIRVKLARESPQTFFCNEAKFQCLGICLSNLGQCEEALTSAAEVVRVFQRLARENPSAFRPYLARSLTDRGYWFYKLGRHQEGLRDGRAALGIYRHLEGPNLQEWQLERARALNNLGVQLRDLGRHNSALNAFQEAIQIYRQIAEGNMIKFQSYLANCISNWGFCLGDLGRREESLSAAKEALEIFQGLAQMNPDSAEFELETARYLHHLGVSLCNSRLYDEALEASEQALSIYRRWRQRQPVDHDHAEEIDVWIARSLTNCGYCMVSLGRPIEALDAAKESVEIYSRWNRQPDLARSFYNLGNRFATIGQHEEALDAARSALHLYRLLATESSRLFGSHVARSLNNVGIRLGHLGRREEALAAAKKALATASRAGVYQRNVDLGIPAESHRQIALAKMQMNDLQGARSHLASATSLIERGSHRLVRAIDRELAIQRFSGCLELRVRVALRCWEVKRRQVYLREALQAAESARSRHLLELLGDAERLPNASSLTRRAWRNHRRAVHQAQWRLEALERGDAEGQDRSLGGRRSSSQWAGQRWAFTQVREESAKSIPPDPQELRKARTELRTAKAGLDRLVAEIRLKDPDFEPFQPVRPLSARDQLSMVSASDSEVWCLSWLVTEDRTFAFALGPGVQPVGLDLGDAGSKSLKQAASGLDWTGDLQQSSLRRVAELILWPVMRHLPREARGCLPPHLILVTNGILQSLPLHALPLPDEWGGGCLGDQFATTTTPSLSLAHRLARHAPAVCRGALAVVNPESWHEGFLAFGALEAIAFREHHAHAKVRLGREATVDGLIRSAASGSGIVHVSAHMGSDPVDPLASRIRLSGKSLTLRDLYGKLKMDGTWLTILNGCQSGVMGEAAAGHPEGLPLGFLFGGSTNVISTLHTVFDVSSALLMDRFHQELRPGVSVSMALKHASDWLRGHRTEAVPDALVDGPTAARAIRAFTARARAFRGKPTLGKPWPEILRHCMDRAREVETDPQPPFRTLQHWAAHVAIGASWLPTPPPRRRRSASARKP